MLSKNYFRGKNKTQLAFKSDLQSFLTSCLVNLKDATR